jgi:zinc protease
MLRRLPMQRASVDAIAALDLRLTELGLPLDSPSISARHYYDATSASVQAAFKKWLRPDDLAEIVKGPSVSQ